ncbi:MAG: FIST N-terminal domain-containing protein [Candidatus Omnitrophota bacterium]
MNIGLGISLEKTPTQAAKEATSQAVSCLNKRKIDLAICFSSIDLSCFTLLKTISGLLPGVPLIGSSGEAIMTNQGILKHGLAIMLISLPEGVYIHTAAVKNIKSKSGSSAGQELGDHLLTGFGNMRRAFSVIFSDALIEESANLISGIQEKLGKSFPFIGGSAADNLTQVKTNLYYNQEIFSDGCVGMLWGGKLNFGMGIKHGWKPLGKPHTVTLSQGNIVVTIDDIPAAQLYESYLGYNLAKLKRELKHISIFYPIGIYLPGEKEYLLRNVLSVDNDGSLRFQGDVPQGSMVRIMISTKETCLEATRQAIDDSKKSIYNPMTEHRKENERNFIIAFSSLSRYLLLKREAEQELEIIKKSFGQDTPILGLYTHGEVAPLTAENYLGKVYLHNQSITILNIGG